MSIRRCEDRPCGACTEPAAANRALEIIHARSCSTPRSGDFARAGAVLFLHHQYSALDRLHLRDLRHTAARQGIMAGENLPLLDNLLNLLGHRRHRTTGGYAHVTDAHLVEAAEKVGAFVSRARAIPEAEYRSENAVYPKRCSG